MIVRCRGFHDEMLFTACINHYHVAIDTIASAGAASITVGTPQYIITISMVRSRVIFTIIAIVTVLI